MGALLASVEVSATCAACVDARLHRDVESESGPLCVAGDCGAIRDLVTLDGIWLALDGLRDCDFEALSRWMIEVETPQRSTSGRVRSRLHLFKWGQDPFSDHHPLKTNA